MKNKRSTYRHGSRFLAALTLIAGSASLSADDAPVNLDPATLTGDALSGGNPALRHNVADVELARKGARSLQEVVEAIPGVQAGSRAGDEVRISVRGSGLQNVVFTKSSGIDLLLDGFPVGGADGNFEYSLISPALAKRVDFFVGAEANRLGTLALGGAVDFVSPRAESEVGRVRLDVGSFGYFRGIVEQGWTNGAWDATAQAELSRADGFRDFSERDSQKLGFNLGWQGENGISNRTFLNFARVDQEISLPISQAELDDDPEQGRVNGPPGNFNMNALTRPFYETHALRLANRTRFQTDEDTLWELGTYYLHRDIDFRRPSLPVPPPFAYQRGPGWLEARSHDFGGHLTFSNEGTLGGRANAFTAGLRISALSGTEEIWNNVQGNKGAKFADGDLWASNFVASFENEWSASEDWALILGGRAFYAERNYEDNRPGSPNGDRDQDYAGLAPKIGLENRSIEGLRIFGSIARNIQPPTFGDIITIPVLPPPTPQGIDPQEIDEQKAWVAEIGVAGENQRTQWQASVYYSWLRDEIIRFAPDPGVATVGNQTGKNADRTEHIGFEAAVRHLLWHDGAYEAGDRLSLHASYTLREHRFDGDATFGNNELAGVPTQLLYAELLYESADGWYFGPNLTGIPADFYIDNANTFKADGYVLLGLRAGWERDNWSVFAEVRNLLDEEHAAAWQNVVDAGGADQSIFFPGEGRAFNIGLEYRW